MRVYLKFLNFNGDWQEKEKEKEGGETGRKIYQIGLPHLTLESIFLLSSFRLLVRMNFCKEFLQNLHTFVFCFFLFYFSFSLFLFSKYLNMAPRIIDYRSIRLSRPGEQNMQYGFVLFVVGWVFLGWFYKNICHTCIHGKRLEMYCSEAESFDRRRLTKSTSRLLDCIFTGELIQ